MVICANLLVKNNGKYNVIQRSSEKKFAPNFVVPYGGKVVNGENPALAACRELLEESGLKVSNVKLSAVVIEQHSSPDMSGNWLVYYFVGDYESGELIPTDEGQALLMSAEQFKNELLFPTFKVILPYILANNERPIVATMSYDNDHNLIDHKIVEC